MNNPPNRCRSRNDIIVRRTMSMKSNDFYRIDESMFGFDKIDPVECKEDIEMFEEKEHLKELNTLLSNLELEQQDKVSSGECEETACSQEEICGILRRSSSKQSSSTLNFNRPRPKVSLAGRVLHSDKNLISRISSSMPMPDRVVPIRVSNPFYKNFMDN
jgi:hypothetical protein